jgi:hypothetical protein
MLAMPGWQECASGVDRVPVYLIVAGFNHARKRHAARAIHIDRYEYSHQTRTAGSFIATDTRARNATANQTNGSRSHRVIIYIYYMPPVHRIVLIGFRFTRKTTKGFAINYTLLHTGSSKLESITQGRCVTLEADGSSTLLIAKGGDNAYLYELIGFRFTVLQ